MNSEQAEKHEPTLAEIRRDYYRAGLVEVELEHEFDAETGPLALVVKAWYRPGRSAPECRDPNMNAYADPGDPSEFEVEVVQFKNGGHLAEQAWKGDPEFEAAVGEALDKWFEEARP